MITITEKQYTALWKKIYMAFMEEGDLGLGEMGPAEEAAKGIVDAWMKEERVINFNDLPFSQGFELFSPVDASHLCAIDLDTIAEGSKILLCNNTSWWIEMRKDGIFYSDGEHNGLEATLPEVIAFLQEHYINMVR